MDWDNARTFLALYRSGTLRSAAAALEVDQATVGRRLAALETSLEARLFLRTPRGYVPTTAGELAYAAAERMEQAADQLERQMQGLDRRLSGTVRVATSDTIGRHFLMSSIARLQSQHPGIRIVLATSTHVTNLTRREADLAVRSVRPDNPDLIVRHLSRRAVGLYASHDYLQRYGEPRQGEAFAGHRVVTYTSGALKYRIEALCGESIRNATVAVEANSGLMIVEAVINGLGIGELPVHMAQEIPQLVRIWPKQEEGYDIWLVMHADLHRTARVRAVADVIVEAFAQAY
ncbi:MAG TPA: LysR family transcriptional regulator [Bordetella sp.]|uniref:LysR family transcriptional regulator n=1 Tax=Bordetella sp. TaxID=28081 RepID=UPI002ECFE998